MKGHIILIIILALAMLCALWIAFCGYQWSWGLFHRLHDLRTVGLPGNNAEYDTAQIVPLEGSPLKGKDIFFLGSSVTYGAAAQGVSFVDYIGARNGCEIVKEAVSGTTLVDDSDDSYISRLKWLDTGEKVDLFVCQLSTNDASQKKLMGSLSDGTEYDTHTVAGAIEWIIAYARETWDCPVVFYTNPRYDSEAYRAMVDLLQQIAGKWNITVIDLWNDGDFNTISAKERALYMADSIHPTKAGYLLWWMPHIENVLYEAIEK